jgi:hypothetical protein
MPLPTSIASDIAHISEHAGVPVVYGTQRCFGVLKTDEAILDVSDGIQVQGVATILRVPVDALTGVQQNTNITIDGAAYRVRSVAPETSARRLRLIVTKVPS